MKDETWRERMAGLETIDWSKKNPDWENVCIIANSVVSNRQARAATKAYIKAKLNMELTEFREALLGKASCLRATTMEGCKPLHFFCESRRQRGLGEGVLESRLVPLERFELPTLALRKPCSTPELQRLAALP
jgi:hypothetical protein